MMKLTTFTATVALAAGFAFGFAGAAMADPTVEQLVNEGAEDGVLTPWSASGAAGGVANVGAGARTGDFVFTTAAINDQGDVTIDQDVDIGECGVEGLDGSWAADGFVITDNNSDTGQLVVMLDDGSGASGAAVNSQGSYAALGPIGGPISADATNANVSMIGDDFDGDSTAFADFDDMSLRITCVADFAKISGVKEQKAGKGGGSKDNGPKYAFSGTVGTFDDPGGTLGGDIVINYRQLGPTSCAFTPTSIAYNGDISVRIEADYECVGGDKDGDMGTATIDMTARDAVPGCLDGKGKKNRGSIAVAADDDDLDISGAEGFTGVENCLATGNVIIDDDAQG